MQERTAGAWDLDSSGRPLYRKRRHVLRARRASLSRETLEQRQQCYLALAAHLPASISALPRTPALFWRCRPQTGA